jgi:hypothetical protein
MKPSGGQAVQGRPGQHLPLDPPRSAGPAPRLISGETSEADSQRRKWAELGSLRGLVLPQTRSGNGGMMRKILYSPGYGAGWTSWAHGGDPEHIRFMLDYPPWVAYLEAGGKFEEKGEWSKDFEQPWLSFLAGREQVEQFCRDWKTRFPDADYPYMGGIHQLKVAEIPDGLKVRIDEYDGLETYLVEGDTEGWL